MPAPRLPICTFETVQVEYERLHKLAPGIAQALHDELLTGAVPDSSVCLPDELRDELDDIEREIEVLEERRDELLDQLALLDGPTPANAKVLEQAETVRVLLRGGDPVRMAAINAAIAQARRELGG